MKWLPPALWKVAVNEAGRMRGRGVQFVLIKGRAPAIVMTMPDGGKFVLATFTSNHSNDREIIPTVARVVIDGLKDVK